MPTIVYAVTLIGIFLTGMTADAGTLIRDVSPTRATTAATPRSTTPAPAPKVERPRRAFVISVERDGKWVEAGTVPANRFLADRRLDLTGWVNGENATRVRIVPINGGLAHADAVTLAGRLPLDSSDGFRAELAAADLDVIEVPPEGLDLTFPRGDTEPALLELTARIEPTVISKEPFRFPPQNTFHPMKADSAFYSYRPASHPGRLTVDGDLGAEALGEPFFTERIPCDSGHPQGATYGWVMDDGKNLYVALDFTPDNTMDGDADYAAVYVERDGELLERRVTASDGRWGRTAFGPTDRAAYRHKTYEFTMPLEDLVEPGAGSVRLAFATYGTASAGGNLADMLAFDSHSRTYGLIYWEQPADFTLKAQIFDGDGSALGSPIPLGSTTGSQPFSGVAADPTSETFLAAWVDYTNARIMGRRFYPDGSAEPSAFEISDIGVGDSPGPARAEFDPVNRRYLVIWTDERTGSGNRHLYGRFVGSDGVPQGTGSFPIEDTMIVHQYTPALAYDSADRQFLVAWKDNSNAVYALRLKAATGQFIGTAFQVEASTSSNLDLDVAYSAVDGSYLVVWTGSGTTYDRRVLPDATVGDLRILMSSSFLELARVSPHAWVPRFMVAAVEYTTAYQVYGRLADAGDGVGVGNRFDVTSPTDNADGIGSAANPHDHCLAVGYYDGLSGTPKIGFANGLFVGGDPATTTELGLTAGVGVRLCAAPTGDVVVDVASGDLGEGTVSPAQLTFTTGDWSTEQEVTITPVNDAVTDGSVTYAVSLTVNDALSADDYDGIIDTITVTNLDAEGFVFYDGFETGNALQWDFSSP